MTERTIGHREAAAPMRVGRLLAAASVVAGISTSVYAVSTAAAATKSSVKSVVVSTTKNSKLGTILVSGKTLYTVNKSDCTGKCSKFWPPLLLAKGVTKATAGKGVSAAKLGTVKVAGGALQVTYSGKPLFRYFGDSAAGQVHGNDVTDTWGTWSVVVTVKPTTTSSSSSSGSTSSGGSTTTTTSGGNSGTGGVAF